MVSNTNMSNGLRATDANKRHPEGETTGLKFMAKDGDKLPWECSVQVRTQPQFHPQNIVALRYWSKATMAKKTSQMLGFLWKGLGMTYKALLFLVQNQGVVIPV